MEEIVLKAVPRNGSPKQARRNGFIPGVLNAHDTASSPVQFEAAALSKAIARHGSSAKLWLESGGEKKYGVIKEVQYHPVEGKIIHVSIQLISLEQDIRIQLPIAFHGRDALEHNLLQLLIHKTDVEVEGHADLIPEIVVIDVSKKALGDTITAADFHLPAQVKVLDPVHEIYAVIKEHKKIPVEEAEAKPEAVAPVKAETAKEPAAGSVA